MQKKPLIDPDKAPNPFRDKPYFSSSSDPESDRSRFWNRTLSLLLAAIPFLWFWIHFHSPHFRYFRDLATCEGSLFFPLGLIWFPEKIKPYRTAADNTPPFYVPRSWMRWLGWMMLLALTVLPPTLSWLINGNFF